VHQLILKCIRSRDSQLLVHAVCTFVRPLLEFSSIGLIWSSYNIAALKRIESVQRFLTKVIKNLHFSTYKEHFINLCFDNLQCRRIKAGLVFCCVLLHKLVDVKSKEMFPLSQNTNLRGNRFKLVKPKSASVRNNNLFVNRVIESSVFGTLCLIVDILLLLSPCLALSKHRL
jgi:hypothetical protein